MVAQFAVQNVGVLSEQEGEDGDVLVFDGGGDDGVGYGGRREGGEDLRDDLSVFIPSCRFEHLGCDGEAIAHRLLAIVLAFGRRMAWVDIQLGE